jgi:hypothetical protein
MARIRPDADAVTIGSAIRNVQCDTEAPDGVINLADVTLALLAQVMTLNQAVMELQQGKPVNHGTKSQLLAFREN